MTTRLKSAMPAIASTRNAAPFTTQRARPLTSFSSCQQPIVPGRSQPLLQMKHRIALAREQRVDTHPRARRQFLEGATVELVRHEHLALLVRQLLERRSDLIKHQLTNDGRHWPIVLC